MSAAVRAGYKLTEVGVIPEDWHVTPLGELAELTSSKRIFEDDYVSFGIPFFRGKEISMLVDGDAIDDPCFISEARFSAIKSRFGAPARGDILITAVGTLGNVYVVDTDEPFYFKDGNLIWLRSIVGIAPQFLGIQLRRAKSTILDGAIGSSQKALTMVVLRKLPVPSPPLPEQRAIATALSDVDALLAKLDALIAKKRDLKVAVMQQLLTGQTRLPGFSGEWGVKRMKSLGNTYGGLTGKTKIDFGHGRARYIPFMNVMTDTVIDSEWLEAVDVASNEVQNLTQKGDLFFNGSSETPEEVGFCSVLLQDIPNLYLNSFCFGFRFNADAKVNGLFFAYWFRSVKGRETMAVLAQGATRYNIAKSAFLRLELPQPTQSEQTAIATVLSDMNAELTALEARRDKTRALKQGMMQDLLTGRIRLV